MRTAIIINLNGKFKISEIEIMKKKLFFFTGNHTYFIIRDIIFHNIKHRSIRYRYYIK